MKFKTLAGRERSVFNLKKYLIDWDASSRSKRQFAVKKYLKKYWAKQVVFEEFPVAGTKLSLDFFNANKRLAIEVQGEQHTKYVPFFHGGNKINYLAQLRRDQEKSRFCELNDIELIEIYPKDSINKDFFKSHGVTL